MNPESIWIVILGGMIITYSLRLSFLVVLGKESIPLWLFRCLRFTPAVVLSALITQLIVKNGNVIQISFQNPRIIAGLVALIIAWKTKNTIITLLAGMCALWILNYLI